MSESRDMCVRVTVGDVEIVINVEAVSFSPDVLSDIVTRAIGGLGEALSLAAAYNIEAEADAEDG